MYGNIERLFSAFYNSSHDMVTSFDANDAETEAFKNGDDF